jgi:hypothetical protein
MQPEFYAGGFKAGKVTRGVSAEPSKRGIFRPPGGLLH